MERVDEGLRALLVAGGVEVVEVAVLLVVRATALLHLLYEAYLGIEIIPKRRLFKDRLQRLSTRLLRRRLEQVRTTHPIN